MPIGVKFTLAEMDKAVQSSRGNPMVLIETDEMPTIAGVNSPSDLYWVLKSPAPLAGMRFPRPDFPWRGLSEVGLGGVVALAPSSYDPSPLKLLFSHRLEDLCHGGNPRNPKKEERLITDAVEITLRSLKSGQGVVVHCIGGQRSNRNCLGGSPTEARIRIS